MVGVGISPSRPNEALAQNNLLGHLRPRDRALIAPALREVTVGKGDVLYEPGDDVRHVYFPCASSLISFRIVLDDGKATEAALIGREGAVAGIVSQGRLPAYARAVVQFPGPLLKLGVDDLEAAKQQSTSLRNLFARYADCLLAQIFQSVACNAVHSIEQRAAKWLLSAMERTGDRVVPLTQEQLAHMLGVGRSYVSRVIGTMKARDLIVTRRGALSIPSLEALTATACDCQAAVKRHFDQVLAGVYPTELDEEREREIAAGG